MRAVILLACCLTALSLAPSRSEAQQAFSCPWGTDGACLDFGDKVCDRTAKCVDEDAVCFSSNTCNFSGFVCKSDLDEAVRKHDDLVDEYNDLLNNYREMSRRADTLREDLIEVGDCLATAQTLDDFRECHVP
ncbi:hypothetical protein [Breoghania sp.]|uniref:hypothetical protein n=1 Tax=Breoghania sp. TaxID=2065378 RepID=UPI0026342408|nr:hypothetical protein [Breoghania sp.]MDJ0932721.1 hypothetical protein [Breoghania sp.]